MPQIACEGLTAVLLKDISDGGNSRRSEEHTSELQSLRHLVCRLLLEKKNRRCSTFRRKWRHRAPARTRRARRMSRNSRRRRGHPSRLAKTARTAAASPPRPAATKLLP